MTTLFIKNAEVLVAMSDIDVTEGTPQQEIKKGALVVLDNKIEFVGTTDEATRFVETRPDLARAGFDRVIDVSGCAVIPGLINCHHHLYQTLTRTIGTGSGKILFDWLNRRGRPMSRLN